MLSEREPPAAIVSEKPRGNEALSHEPWLTFATTVTAVLVRFVIVELANPYPPTKVVLSETVLGDADIKVLPPPPPPPPGVLLLLTVITLLSVPLCVIVMVAPE